MSADAPLLRLEGVGKAYRADPQASPAVDGVSLRIGAGTITGIVGESGSGKTTLARMMAGLLRPSTGEIRFDGVPLASLGSRALRRLRANLQYVHQDPAAALDPRYRVRDILHEPLRIHTPLSREDRHSRILALLGAVSLSPDLLDRFPHQLSGGQQRRVGLARILVLEPRLVIFDEPTAGLDLLVQSSLLALLRELRERLSLTYVVVTHDLTVVEALCETMITMFQGCVVEQGQVHTVLETPSHPYTRQLLSALPTLDGPRVIDQSSWDELPYEAGPAQEGCPFLARCGHKTQQCAATRPPLAEIDGRLVACWVQSRALGEP